MQSVWSNSFRFYLQKLYYRAYSISVKQQHPSFLQTLVTSPHFKWRAVITENDLLLLLFGYCCLQFLSWSHGHCPLVTLQMKKVVLFCSSGLGCMVQYRGTTRSRFYSSFHLHHLSSSSSSFVHAHSALLFSGRYIEWPVFSLSSAPTAPS